MNTQSRPLGWTTLEESKKLLEAGLSPDTADMHIISYQDDKGGYFDTALCYSKWDAVHIKGYYPCWSLGALEKLIPQNIKTADKAENIYELHYRKYNISDKHEVCVYQLAYGNNRGLSMEWHDMINTAECDTMIESVINMILWLLDNKKDMEDENN